MNEFMQVKDWHSQQIHFELATGGQALHCRPIELHHKDNGGTDADGFDIPSFALVMEVPASPHIAVGQFSLATIIDCFAQLGYELRKKT